MNKLLAAFILILIVHAPLARANKCVESVNDPLTTEDLVNQLLPALHRQAALSESIKWKSDFLKDRLVTDPQKARQISDSVFEVKQLQYEVAQAIKDMGGPQSPALWDAYFQRAYNTVAASSSSYLQTVALSISKLPSGKIIDFGSGPGNFSLAILLSSPYRTVHGIDMSPLAVQSATNMLTATVPQAKGRFHFQNGNLLEMPPNQLKGDGGVMNNVLYNMQTTREKVNLLKKVRSQLKPGARFVLNDPLPKGQNEAELKNWLASLADSATRNGSPLTEYDIAFLSEINRSQLTRGNIPFSTPKELINIAQQAGFVLVEGPLETYGGLVTSLVLEVP